MFRLGLILAAAIYGAMVILPSGTDDLPDRAQAPEQADPGEARRASRPDPSEISSLTIENGETWQIDRVIRLQEPPADAANDPQGTAAETLTTETGTDAAVAEALAAGDNETGSDATLLYVTGDRVNLRTGPSTDNDIVRALTRGTAAELIATADDGWLEIRDTETGAQGFMSGDFLSTQAP